MPLIRLLALAACLGISALTARALDVLFVGNSFTYGNSTYNNAAITDANGTGHGGLPAAFKKLATEGGYPGVNVTIEAVGGQSLTYHYTDKAALIGKAWDYVVLQDHSQRPTTTFVGGNVAAFRLAVQNLNALVKQYNPAVRVLLYETWARPDMVPTYYSALSVMQNELRGSYSAAAADFGLHGWVPVGDGYMQALDTGLAYNPTQGAVAGKFNLFVSDNYHPSGHGCYLAACMFYSKILGGDPRLLPTGAGSAAAALGLSAADAANLQQLASSLVPPPPSPTAIGKQPAAAVARPGGSVSFSVVATGTSLAYQWRHNGSPLAGQTAATLSLSNVQSANAGLYDVVVTGSAGSVTSAAVPLTVTSREATSSWYFDLGSPSAGYPTPSPDSAGRHWNQLTNSAAGAALSPIVTSTGASHATASVSIVTAFSGINQGGINATGAYPSTAQWDSFFVTGTGTTGSARKGELQFFGLNTGATYTLKLFGTRSGSGTRITRYTVPGVPPGYLETINNTSNTVTLGPVSPQANGTLLLTVEPYNASGAMTEYGYLNVVEVTESVPSPSAYETWSSGRGLSGANAAYAADPDGDGRANLAEFALGTDPANADAALGLAGSVADLNGARRLSLVVQKSPAATGLTYSAEVSSDLVTWTGDVTVVEDSAATFHARDNAALASVPRRFIRLKMSGSP